MSYSAFQVSHHKIKYVASVCLLLISKWMGLVTSITDPAPQIKYQVFINFRGPDIRQGFLSHLIRALSQKDVAVFVDYNITKGDEISDTLLGAIEGSLISLIIFSPNYASSSWCLKELVKIIECRKKYGQIVLPIFFKVDPSDVRHQKGTYGDAFAEHERKEDNLTTVKWRSALNEAANIAGFHLSTFRNEAELIEDIVKSVLVKLNQMDHVNFRELNEIGKRIVSDGHIMGICGMVRIGGINKTAIAQESTRHRGESGRHGIISLKQKHFSTLLGEDLKIDTPNGLPQFVERRVDHMKVLIILDDVNDSEQLEILAGTHD